MRVLPSGSTALLVELDDLEEVLALYSALKDHAPPGVLDLVPAARTLLVVTDPSRRSLDSVEAVLRDTTPRRGERTAGELVEIPVRYDGEDLPGLAETLGWGVDELVRRHTEDEWTVAFCGFAPGFGYMTSASRSWQVPRRPSPRTKVPAGAVALAGEFSGVYPRESPGGWQLIGRTDVQVFDLDRDPPALLSPGTRVRFVEVGR